MSNENKKSVRKLKKASPAMCETCEFYDFDEYLDAYICNMKLDEDEMLSFISGNEKGCPYYRFYDEYKSVAKQN